MTENTDYRIRFGKENQLVILQHLLGDPTAYSVTQNILRPEYFEPALGRVVEFIQSYVSSYQTLPTTAQISANTGHHIEPALHADHHREWTTTEIEAMCRYRALERTILEGPDILATGDGATIEKRIKDAMTISLMKDLGTSYYEDPLERLARMKDRSAYVSTGWKTLDEKLYGGFTRGALNVFAGGSGAGKSLFLLNIARNWAKAGMRVVYISLELSEDLVSMRMDAMTSGIQSREILSREREVAIAVKQEARTINKGKLIIKKMPESGTTANALRAYLKEYEIQTGEEIDALIVDYLDLMHPNNGKVTPSDLFVKDKYVSEELRALAHDYEILFVTASQLNRSSYETEQFDHSHIAGGISKINTADNVFGILNNKRDSGKIELQFMKTRSSAAVGQRIELSMDSASLRIGDLDDPNGELKPATTAQTQQALRKNVSNERVDPETGEVFTPQNSVMDLINKNRP